jgi:hypothetical protein
MAWTGLTRALSRRRFLKRSEIAWVRRVRAFEARCPSADSECGPQWVVTSLASSPRTLVGIGVLRSRVGMVKKMASGLAIVTTESGRKCVPVEEAGSE